MEMGKLTAKLRNAVPVCLLVEGKEIKRYKNIEIPDELKKLEYQDFKFDVPLNGSITFKIKFEPGVLPEEFPQMRERRTRKPLAQETQPEEEAPAVEVAVLVTEPQPQEEQMTEALPAPVAEIITCTLEDTQAAGEPVADIAKAMADGEGIKSDIIEDGSEELLPVIKAEPECIEEMTRLKSDEPAMKPMGKVGARSVRHPRKIHASKPVHKNPAKAPDFLCLGSGGASLHDLHDFM